MLVMGLHDFFFFSSTLINLLIATRFSIPPEITCANKTKEA